MNYSDIHMDDKRYCRDADAASVLCDHSGVIDANLALLLRRVKSGILDQDDHARAVRTINNLLGQRRRTQ